MKNWVRKENASLCENEKRKHKHKAVQIWEKNRITKENIKYPLHKKKNIKEIICSIYNDKKENISLQGRGHLALYMIHLIHPYKIICVTIHLITNCDHPNRRLFCYTIVPVAPPNQPTSTQNLFLSTLMQFNLCLSHLFQKINTLFPTKTLSSLIISFIRFFFFFFFFIPIFFYTLHPGFFLQDGA